MRSKTNNNRGSSPLSYKRHDILPPLLPREHFDHDLSASCTLRVVRVIYRKVNRVCTLPVGKTPTVKDHDPDIQRTLYSQPLGRAFPLLLLQISCEMEGKDPVSREVGCRYPPLPLVLADAC